MTTLATYRKSNKSASFWFTSTKELKIIGFSENEIETAIKQAGYTAESLTDLIYAEASKDNYYSQNENYELVTENTSWIFEEQKIIKGQVFTRQYQARANEYRCAGNYQSTKHEKILRNLLNNRFPYLRKYKYEVYSLHGEGKNWEIYLITSNGSLYVPVQALIKKDPTLINKRMIEYWNWYRKERDPKATKHNHKQNEHPQNCGLCQQRFYDKEMKPLESLITKRFFKEVMN